ncbi:hypothetical protein HYR99_04775 [Candidatus Poribacteria bacterium]|nr:hypothetical protein [Candidatus Poribacteria bacterium]
MSLPASLPLTSEAWNKTPPAVVALVGVLWTEVSALRAEVCARREPVDPNPRHWSRPPSSDPPSVPKRRRHPSERKRGGHPGHEGLRGEPSNLWKR